ncbi:hypothetical protein [uncultured Mycolicibacterium sp.]|uniref:hypothetical protein n=1 Tax=uncultured Mycolicibacterium sp. TaxID=2320817 RepID=UPI0032B20ABF
MGVNPILERHLREAREELLAQRAKLDEDIKQVDLLLKGCSTVSTSLAELARRDTDEAAAIATAINRQRTGEINDYNRRVSEHNRQIARRVDGTRASKSDARTSMRDTILLYLTEAGEPVTTQTITADLSEKYGWAESSIRSLLSRLSSEETIVGVRRGLYATPETVPVGSQIDDADLLASLTGSAEFDEVETNSAADEAEMRLA